MNDLRKIINLNIELINEHQHYYNDLLNYIKYFDDHNFDKEKRIAEIKLEIFESVFNDYKEFLKNIDNLTK